MNRDWEKLYSRARKQIGNSRPVSTLESKVYEERRRPGVCIRCGKKKELSLPYCAESIQEFYERLKDEDIIGVCSWCLQTFS
jgi:hypothetical protein